MAEVKEKGPVTLSFIERFVLKAIGIGVGTVVGQTATAPIDRVKLLLQSQGEMLKQGIISRPYTGATDCTMQIFRNEGLIQFWRGYLASCIRHFSNGVLNAAFKDKIKGMFKQDKNDPYIISFVKNVASGGIAGALSLFFVYSLDYARTRLANDVISTTQGGGERIYDGLIDVYRKTLTTDGIAGLYRGFSISCAGIIIYRACYFGLYDILKPIILGPDASLRLSFLLGYGVTVLSGFISYPFDTISRRMMMTSGQAVHYKNALDCMFQIIQNEGTIALFQGAGVMFLRGIVGACVLSVLDKLVELYTRAKADNGASG